MIKDRLNSNKKLRFAGNTQLIILFVSVFLTSAALITLNYFTIKTTSAVRAYINGESEYSKGQKDALLNLTAYIQTRDENSWVLFKKALSVPVGDNIARQNMVNGSNNELVVKSFLDGKNQPADIEGMIWLFKNFKTISFMKEAIAIWESAEPLINRLAAIGDELHLNISSGRMTASGSHLYIKEIESISSNLTQKERAFSNTLGDAGRTISKYLFFANTLFTILIVGALFSYVIVIINRLLTSEEALQYKNEGLTSTNRELDSFVYSASHDLRSPINSLKGLVQLTSLEDDRIKVNEYLGFMNKVIDKLDLYIRELIDFSRNKSTDITIEAISLVKLIEEALAQVKYMPEAANIRVETSLEADLVRTDPTRIKMILNNLLSNAVKYCDPLKAAPFIKVKTRTELQQIVIEIADNGIGINPQYHERIFDMFFVTNSKKGTGLGLYIIKETVAKLHGKIRVISEEGMGSTFIINLPVNITAHPVDEPKEA